MSVVVFFLYVFKYVFNSGLHFRVGGNFVLKGCYITLNSVLVSPPAPQV